MKSHRIKLEDLIQLKRDAIDENKDPAYVIEFEEADEEWIAIPKWLFDSKFRD